MAGSLARLSAAQLRWSTAPRHNARPRKRTTYSENRHAVFSLPQTTVDGAAPARYLRYMDKRITKSNEEIAMMMMLRPAKTPEGKRVQAAVLARVEITIAIETALRA